MTQFRPRTRRGGATSVPKVADANSDSVSMEAAQLLTDFIRVAGMAIMSQVPWKIETLLEKATAGLDPEVIQDGQDTRITGLDSRQS